MLTDLIKEHDKIKHKTQKECEQKWQDIKKMSKGVTTHLHNSITEGVNVVFHNQRHLEIELNKLQTQIGKFYKESDQWKDLIKKINEPLKELGDVENWMRTIDQNLKDLVLCVNFVNEYQNEKEVEQKKLEEIEEKRRLKLQEEQKQKQKEKEKELINKKKEEKLMKEKHEQEQKQKKLMEKEKIPKKKQKKTTHKPNSTQKTKRKKERSLKNKSEKSNPQNKTQKKKKLSNLEKENELLKKKIEEMRKQMMTKNETEKN
ncbi:bloc-1 complex subunit [Anaeramoeba flamelloides]|uniref:Biogenesis of lysosome-related organelles complex 1 subunit 1 n=1 Tax=Anaeramoeba flamelloides TaxID=1746091 RepID=A0AAV8A7M5_9EUKA|nr:bloc-1 complex subunit [Anaeramoeba flamelloides]